MMNMNYDKGNSGLAGQKLLSIIMVAVLAVSIAMAWTMVRVRGEPVRNAVAILDEIQSRTLRGYWPAEGRRQWYLGADTTGKPVGWCGLAVAKGDDGFKYVWIQTFKDQGLRTICTISPDGRTETIDSTARKVSFHGEISVVATSRVKVNYASGRVEAWVLGAGDRASINAPSNYLPWGLTEIAARIVNQTQQEATFKTILLEQPVYQRQVVLERLTMTPLGDNAVRCESLAGERKSSVIYHLDAYGLLSGFDVPAHGFIFKRVTFEELVEVFPEVRRYRAAATRSDKPDRAD